MVGYRVCRVFRDKLQDGVGCMVALLESFSAQGEEVLALEIYEYRNNWVHLFWKYEHFMKALHTTFLYQSYF